MNRNLIIGIVVVAVIAVGAALLLRTSPSSQNAPSEQTQATEQPTQAVTDPTGGDAMDADVKEFTVTGSPFKFDPKEIKVSKGDKVKIVFKNAAGTHDWVLDEFNAKTPTIQGGEEATVEFTADKVGSFEYYCSVGNHRAMGMVGTLVVE